MFIHVFILVVLIGSLTSKPVVVRNVSDCSITDDGILHYHGKHSFTKFEHECLPWNDVQLIYADIINEANFVYDRSVKAAKNYCRNPNMNVNGPWCFIQNEDVITMEHCDVCQSLAPKPTLPTDIGSVDDVTDVGVSRGFFQMLLDDIKRYGAYIREKFWEIIERLRKKFKHIGSKISDYFNYNG